MSRARATNFVENNLESGSPPYTLALAAYALALSDSPNKLTALEWLRNVVVHDQGTCAAAGETDRPRGDRHGTRGAETHRALVGDWCQMGLLCGVRKTLLVRNRH